MSDVADVNSMLFSGKKRVYDVCHYLTKCVITRQSYPEEGLPPSTVSH